MSAVDKFFVPHFCQLLTDFAHSLLRLPLPWTYITDLLLHARAGQRSVVGYQAGKALMETCVFRS